MSTPMEAYVMFRCPHFLCGKGRLGEAALRATSRCSAPRETRTPTPHKQDKALNPIPTGDRLSCGIRERSCVPRQGRSGRIGQGIRYYGGTTNPRGPA